MHKIHTLLFVLLAALVLAACAPMAVAPAETNAPQPAAAQTLILASGRNLGPGNPHAYDSSMVLLDLVYEPLVRYAPDGSTVPALAESWTISAFYLFCRLGAVETQNALF